MIKKDYLTFNELLEHWGCERHEIHYMISQGELNPSIAWNDPAIVCDWVNSTEDQAPRVLKARHLNDRVFLKDWVCLRRPTVTGPNRYYFLHATIETCPKDSLDIPWYRLLEEDSGNLLPATIRSEYVEENAVFMNCVIDVCETIFQPKISQRVAEIAQAIKQNAHHAADFEKGQDMTFDCIRQPTKLMKLVEVVQERYWGSNWNQDDPSTKTSQTIIWAWLESTHKLTNAQARAVEKVACPFDRNPSKRRS